LSWKKFCHAAHCVSARLSAVVIVSEDTDVFALCVAFSSQISCSIYIKSKTNTCIQYMDNYKVADIFGPDKCKALLSLHAFMGCDTVRAFDGKGKVAGITWQTHAP